MLSIILQWFDCRNGEYNVSQQIMLIFNGIELLFLYEMNGLLCEEVGFIA